MNEEDRIKKARTGEAYPADTAEALYREGKTLFEDVLKHTKEGDELLLPWQEWDALAIYLHSFLPEGAHTSFGHQVFVGETNVKRVVP